MKVRDIVIDLGLAVLLAVLCVALYVKETRDAQPAKAIPYLAPAPAPTTEVRTYERGSEIFRWNRETRTLTITRSMPRDAFICIRNVCELAEVWVPER